MLSRRELANAIRFLSIDAVEAANSGHPGMPMGMADIAEVLWRDHLHHNPANPTWPNRDRFVISNGHGSMLLYSLLHLTGYDLSLDELKHFRQLHSKTPGHPEHGLTPGVETTTGPLGQGLANAVGMALAATHMASEFNRPDFPVIDHDIYVFLGDGCLMEGISHEACSLAGTWKLGRLIAFWDDNGISIDGKVDAWFTDNTPERFQAYGWHVITDVDGHDSAAIQQAIQQAKVVTDKPTLICCKTTIGFGAPTAAGHAKCHGAALGSAEIAATREALAWKHAPFTVPENIYQAWDARAQGKDLEHRWQTMMQAYAKAHPALADTFWRREKRQLPANWKETISKLHQTLAAQTKPIATRKASQLCIANIAPHLPELMGGSADLTESNLTHWDNETSFSAQTPMGRYLHFGVREFGMCAIANGMAVYGGLIPYVATFLTFVDYARNAVRMAALMRQRVIFVFTHDSIGLGEDGPTHQPIEHAAMLRLTPHLQVWRPADVEETAQAWQAAIENQDEPTALLLSRQALPLLNKSATAKNAIARGAYILRHCDGEPELILIATGSEVSIALDAWEQLAQRGMQVRLVSMPSTTTFDKQPADYREYVLPKTVRHRIAVEAAASDFWYKYTGLDGKIIGLNRYGESAPASAIYQALGISTEAIVNEVSCLMTPA